MVVAEAAQRLRLPLISKDGEVHDEDIEKLSVVSRSSLDSTVSGANSSNYNTPNSSVSGANSALAASDPVELGVGGVPNRFWELLLLICGKLSIKKHHYPWYTM